MEVCVTCGSEAGYFNDDGSLSGDSIPLRDFDGTGPLCESCFDTWQSRISGPAMIAAVREGRWRCDCSECQGEMSDDYGAERFCSLPNGLVFCSYACRAEAVLSRLMDLRQQQEQRWAAQRRFGVSAMEWLTVVTGAARAPYCTCERHMPGLVEFKLESMPRKSQGCAICGRFSVPGSSRQIVEWWFKSQGAELL